MTNAKRPMSEHEGALFDAVLAIAATMLEMGANRDAFRARLEKARAETDARGNHNGAATLDFLMSNLFPSSDPSPDPARRPSFHIV
jgi:hypothetical protein